jgi:predicted phage terminase large subunit-like protein
MIRQENNELQWFDNQGDAIDTLIAKGVPHKEAIHIPKSVTFIPSKLSDNKILMEKDPQYKGNLESLSYVDRMRLLHGNWKVRESAGNFFRSEWIEKVPIRPAEMVSMVRYWDRAATEETPSNDPDWTVGVLMGKCKKGYFWILDVIRRRYSPGKVETLIVNTAKHDGKLVHIGLEQEPGASGKMGAGYLARQLAGYTVKCFPAMNAKTVQAKPLSGQCEAGNVKMIDASWNKEYMAIMENFPEGNHDDDVDASSGAFNYLTTIKTIRVH